MAKTRTISATELTERDRGYLQICGDVAKFLKKVIPNPDSAGLFWREYGRTALSRDAGMGVGSGKLQRDALTTRGRSDKSPFSNRNLRWHPLVLAHNTPDYAKEVDSVGVQGKKVFFVVKGVKRFPEDLFKLDVPYCAPYAKWTHLAPTLINWSTDDWSENRCTIPALESSVAEDAVGVYAALGLAIAVGVYQAPPETYDSVLRLLGKRGISNSVIKDMPPLENLVKCPLCLANINDTPARLPGRQRPPKWQPPWRPSKCNEGEEGSLQITHAFPLIDAEQRHRPSMVRYGHRWCNVAMTDHSVEETVDFMKAVVGAQARAQG